MGKIQKKFDLENSFVELLKLAKSGRWISEEDFVKFSKLLKTDLFISANGSELRVRDLYDWFNGPCKGPVGLGGLIPSGSSHPKSRDAKINYANLDSFKSLNQFHARLLHAIDRSKPSVEEFSKQAKKLYLAALDLIASDAPGSIPK
tara:strand:+ start:2383 stop:2823 length:441 start_codon:yes stop_codon:yes gene_type:complete